MKLVKLAAMLAAVAMLAGPALAAEPLTPAKPGHVFIIVLENEDITSLSARRRRRPI